MNGALFVVITIAWAIILFYAMSTHAHISRVVEQDTRCDNCHALLDVDRSSTPRAYVFCSAECVRQWWGQASR